jgi:hypothetical protein
MSGDIRIDFNWTVNISFWYKFMTSIYLIKIQISCKISIRALLGAHKGVGSILRENWTGLYVCIFTKMQDKFMILSRLGWYARRKWRVLVRMIGFISTLVTISALIYTHTGPLLVPQLERRNYSSLTESQTPSITHEWNLLITHQVFTSRRNFRGHLLPRTQNWTVALFVFKITPLHGPTENTVSHCCECIFTTALPGKQTSYISVLSLGADRIENTVSLLFLRLVHFYIAVP